jgi:hypothetical protein
VRVFSVLGKLDALLRPSTQWAFKSQSNALYQAFGGFKADEDFFSRNFLYFRPENRTYPFVLSFISTNFRRKVALLHFTGLGLTRQLIQGEGQQLKVSLAGVYENTRFNQEVFNLPAYNGSPIVNIWRATVYAAGKHVLGQYTSVFYNAYWQPAVPDFKNYRLFFDTGLNWQVKPRLALQCLYLLTGEGLVAQGVQTRDHLITLGFNYTFQVSGK